MKKLLFAAFLFLVAQIAFAQGYNASAVRLSEAEMELYELVMEYRAEKGLPRIPISPALTYVAQTHARDVYNYFGEIPSGCNSHSWSSHGPWSKCDYYPDHRNAEGMWIKPRELTDYTGSGYEIAHYYLPPSAGICTPKESLRGWQNSPGHNAVMINLNIWSSHPWLAIGIGMYKGVAVIWFGEEADTHTMAELPSIKTKAEKEAENKAAEEKKTKYTIDYKEVQLNIPETVQKTAPKTEQKPETVVVVVKDNDKNNKERKTTKKAVREKSNETLLSRYYGHSGKYALSWIGAGYTYSCKSQEHLVSAELLNLRTGLFGLSLLDFEMGFSPELSTWFAYRPSAKIYIPTCKCLSIYLYGGAETDITYLGQYMLPDYEFDAEKNYFLNAFGGLGIQLTGLRWAPLDLRVEYRHPIINTIQPQGIYLSAKLYLTSTWPRK